MQKEIELKYTIKRKKNFSFSRKNASRFMHLKIKQPVFEYVDDYSWYALNQYYAPNLISFKTKREAQEHLAKMFKNPRYKYSIIRIN